MFAFNQTAHQWSFILPFFLRCRIFPGVAARGARRLTGARQAA
jgi:hypothetical protein